MANVSVTELIRSKACTDGFTRTFYRRLWVLSVRDKFAFATQTGRREGPGQVKLDITTHSETSASAALARAVDFATARHGGGWVIGDELTFVDKALDPFVDRRSRQVNPESFDRAWERARGDITWKRCESLRQAMAGTGPAVGMFARGLGGHRSSMLTKEFSKLLASGEHPVSFDGRRGTGVAVIPVAAKRVLDYHYDPTPIWFDVPADRAGQQMLCDKIAELWDPSDHGVFADLGQLIAAVPLLIA